MKFLDILQFLAPGYNLKSFFKAFDAIEENVSSPMTISLLQNNLTRPHSHPMKLSTPLSKDVMYLKKSKCDFSETCSTKENLNKRPFRFYVSRKVQKTGAENYQWLMYESILSLTIPPPPLPPPPPRQNPRKIFSMGEFSTLRAKRKFKFPSLRTYKNELKPHPGAFSSIIHCKKHGKIRQKSCNTARFYHL